MKIINKILTGIGLGKRTKLRRAVSDIGILKIPPRERLSVMYIFTTDKKEYIAYNTQTIQNQDCVNIEIVEKTSRDKEKIILEKEIFEDSWGAMGGDSFYSLVIDSKNHLRDYIKSNEEFIISENDLVLKKKN